MADIARNQLRRLDLTLLLVLEETLATGKLSTTARRLGLTQSAVSHAVGRLRAIFADELFVRTPHGVRPTPRAEALRAPLLEALRLIASAVRPVTFDPVRDARNFRIAAMDYETSLLAPLLADGRNPGPRFVFRSLVRREALDALAKGDVDLLLGYAFERGADCDAVTLYDEHYTVVARAGHPALARRLSLAGYTSHGHVLVSPAGTLEGIVDRSLAQAGAQRRVVLSVPYFLAALAAVAHTDLLATVPARLASRWAAPFGLGQATPPVEVRAFPVHMVWSRRLGSDPAVAWLRERIAVLSAGLGREPPGHVPGVRQRDRRGSRPGRAGGARAAPDGPR